MENLALFFAFLGMAFLTTSAVTVKVNQYVTDFIYLAALEASVLLLAGVGCFYIINNFKYEIIQCCFLGICFGLISGIGFLLVINYLNKTNYKSERQKLTSKSSKLVVIVVMGITLLVWSVFIITAWKFYADNYIQYRTSQGQKTTGCFEIRKAGMKMFFVSSGGGFRCEIPTADARVIEDQLEYGLIQLDLHKTDKWSVKFEYGKVFLNDNLYSTPMLTARKILVLTQLEQAVGK